MALITRDGFDLEAFRRHMDANLPAYARPRFVRLLQHAETTGTFKYNKMDLITEGFDLGQIKDPLYVLNSEGTAFIELTPACQSQIEAGTYRI